MTQPLGVSKGHTMNISPNWSRPFSSMFEKLRLAVAPVAYSDT